MEVDVGLRHMPRIIVIVSLFLTHFGFHFPVVMFTSMVYRESGVMSGEIRVIQGRGGG